MTRQEMSHYPTASQGALLESQALTQTFFLTLFSLCICLIVVCLISRKNWTPLLVSSKATWLYPGSSRSKLFCLFVDPFADVEEEKAPKAANHIRKYKVLWKRKWKRPSLILIGLLDLRIQQRNGRKTLTTLQGLPTQYDNKKILKVFKKEFACNGTIVDDEELGQVLQLSGDQRLKIAEFLVKEEIAKKSEIKVHGF